MILNFIELKGNCSNLIIGRHLKFTEDWGDGYWQQRLVSPIQAILCWCHPCEQSPQWSIRSLSCVLWLWQLLQLAPLHRTPEMKACMNQYKVFKFQHSSMLLTAMKLEDNVKKLTLAVQHFPSPLWIASINPV